MSYVYANANHKNPNEKIIVLAYFQVMIKCEFYSFMRCFARNTLYTYLNFLESLQKIEDCPIRNFIRTIE